MAIKPAKKRYDSEEIREILRRNAALYKDDVGFVDFFVQLSSYFFDRDVRESSASGLQQEDPLQPPTPAPAAKLDPDMDSMQLPPTVADLRRRSGDAVDIDMVPNFQAFRPVGAEKPPPPPEKKLPPEPLPGRPSEAVSAENELPKKPRKSQVFQVKSAGARFRRSTDYQPPPPKPSAEGDPLRASSGSRPRILKPVRPASSIAEYPCQICGATIPPNAKRCPGCGAELV